MIAAGDTATVVAASLLAAATALSPATCPSPRHHRADRQPRRRHLHRQRQGPPATSSTSGSTTPAAPPASPLPRPSSATIVAMASGTLDPVLTTPLGTLGDQPFDYIVQPFPPSTATTAMSLVMNNTTGRWSDISQAYGHRPRRQHRHARQPGQPRRHAE